MNHRSYLAVSGAVFGVVAVGHLLRAVNGWAFRVADFDVPTTASWVAVVVVGALATWAFRLARSG